MHAPIGTFPDRGTHEMTPATGTPATYTGVRGPGTFVITALAFAVKKSTIAFSTCVGV